MRDIASPEIMDILLVKNSHLPPDAPQRTRQTKPFTSAEAVVDSDDEESENAVANIIGSGPAAQQAGQSILQVSRE